MPSQVRSPKSKANRRVAVKAGPDIPIMPIAVAVALVLVAIGLYWYAASTRGSQPVVAGIPCDSLEQTQVHYHIAIQIYYLGTPVQIPTDIGRPSGGCFYWLHMHDGEAGVIHIESPAKSTFTLGDFFDVWGASKNQQIKLDKKHVATFTLTGDQALSIWVDAKPFTGDPRSIPLSKDKNHTVITLEIGPPTVDPPPAFTFPSGT